jgi:hypothetical protein
MTTDGAPISSTSTQRPADRAAATPRLTAASTGMSDRRSGQRATNAFSAVVASSAWVFCFVAPVMKASHIRSPPRSRQPEGSMVAAASGTAWAMRPKVHVMSPRAVARALARAPVVHGHPSFRSIPWRGSVTPRRRARLGAQIGASKPMAAQPSILRREARRSTASGNSLPPPFAAQSAQQSLPAFGEPTSTARTKGISIAATHRAPRLIWR